MGEEPNFSKACRRNVVRSHSEAVRPSLNVTTQEEIKGDGLSHHGDTHMDEAGQHKEKRSASSRDKVERIVSLAKKKDMRRRTRTRTKKPKNH